MSRDNGPGHQSGDGGLSQRSGNSSLGTEAQVWGFRSGWGQRCEFGAFRAGLGTEVAGGPFRGQMRESGSKKEAGDSSRRAIVWATVRGQRRAPTTVGDRGASSGLFDRAWGQMRESGAFDRAWGQSVRPGLFDWAWTEVVGPGQGDRRRLGIAAVWGTEAEDRVQDHVEKQWSQSLGQGQQS